MATACSIAGSNHLNPWNRPQHHPEGIHGKRQPQGWLSCQTGIDRRQRKRQLPTSLCQLPDLQHQPWPAQTFVRFFQSSRTCQLKSLSLRIRPLTIFMLVLDHEQLTVSNQSRQFVMRRSSSPAVMGFFRQYAGRLPFKYASG